MKKSVDKTKKMCYNEFTKENKKQNKKKGEKKQMSMIQISVKAGAVKVDKQRNFAEELQRRADLEKQGIEVSPIILEGTTAEILKYISAEGGVDDLADMVDDNYEISVERFLATVPRSERYFTITDEQGQEIEYDLEKYYNDYKEDEDYYDWEEVARAIVLKDNRVTKADFAYLEDSSQIADLEEALLHYDCIRPDKEDYED